MAKHSDRVRWYGCTEQQARELENHERWLDSIARMDDGSPAYPVAEANGIPLSTFRRRLARGYTGERAATEPLQVGRRRYSAKEPLGVIKGKVK